MPKQKTTRTVHSKQTPETWHERLDKAVMARFKSYDVVCSTSFDIISMRHVTSWRQRNGKVLVPALAKQVREFVAGFMAAEEWYA